VLRLLFSVSILSAPCRAQLCHRATHYLIECAWILASEKTLTFTDHTWESQKGNVRALTLLRTKPILGPHKTRSFRKFVRVWHSKADAPKWAATFCRITAFYVPVAINQGDNTQARCPKYTAGFDARKTLLEENPHGCESCI
jgi:hypothetical protein